MALRAIIRWRFLTICSTFSLYFSFGKSTLTVRLIRAMRRPKYNVREERTGYTVLMWLLIKKFTEKDVGSYKCVSTNSLGKADGTLRLYGKFARVNM